MTSFSINWLAIIVASISSFAIGAIWFGPKTFYPMWIRAQGREVPTERIEMKWTETLLLFGGTYVGALVQAFTLACVIGLARMADPGINGWTGLAFGFAFSVGLGAFASLGHRLFGQPDMKVFMALKVWILEVGQDVLAATVAGAIIGAWL